MKETIQQVKSFITFDFPIDKNYISARFASTHLLHQKDFPQWSTKATQQKLIANYWFSDVFKHFATMVCVPALLISFFYARLDPSYLFVAFLVGVISFPVLLIFHYWPGFYSDFLPKLETIKETYERKRIDQLEKCRKAQLSNFALTLFFYVLVKTNRMDSLKCNDYSANLLMKLYGVDPGSMKKNLELILGTGKRKNMTDRKNTEIRNRFSETYDYLDQLEFAAGIEKLKELEAKFFS